MIESTRTHENCQ